MSYANSYSKLFLNNTESKLLFYNFILPSIMLLRFKDSAKRCKIGCWIISSWISKSLNLRIEVQLSSKISTVALYSCVHCSPYRAIITRFRKIKFRSCTRLWSFARRRANKISVMKGFEALDSATILNGAARKLESASFDAQSRRLRWKFKRS